MVWDREMAAGGVDAVIQGIGAEADPAMRLSHFRAAFAHFDRRDGAGKDLDALVALADAAAATVALLPDPAAYESRRALAATTFNLAAALADCWGDGQPRERRHFARGLAAARLSLATRRGFNAPPQSRALALWAEGYHLLALGDADSAKDAFSMALEDSRLALAPGASDAVSPGGNFFVILNHGYLGLARSIGGDFSGKAMLETAIAAFAATMAGEGEAAEDARLGHDQMVAARDVRVGSAVG